MGKKSVQSITSGVTGRAVVLEEKRGIGSGLN
jgi:hypothetical protein